MGSIYEAPSSVRGISVSSFWWALKDDKPPVFGPVTATFATLFMTPREAELTRQLEVALSALSGMEALRRENQLLRQKLDQITRRFFGVSSEQLPSNQLELVLALPEVEVEVRPGKIEPGPSLEKKTQRSVRKARVPEHLPVVEEVLEPDDVKAAPEQWRRIGAVSYTHLTLPTKRIV